MSAPGATSLALKYLFCQKSKFVTDRFLARDFSSWNPVKFLFLVRTSNLTVNMVEYPSRALEIIVSIA